VDEILHTFWWSPKAAAFRCTGWQHNFALGGRIACIQHLNPQVLTSQLRDRFAICSINAEHKAKLVMVAFTAIMVT
jgi:hypothetical protein